MIKQKARPISKPLIITIHVASNERSHFLPMNPTKFVFLSLHGLACLVFPLKRTSHVSCIERERECHIERDRERERFREGKRDINFQQQGEARICHKSIRRLTPQNPYPIFLYQDFLTYTTFFFFTHSPYLPNHNSHLFFFIA